MRNPRARAALIGLVLALPVLMVMAGPRGKKAWAAVPTVAGVELILIGGLLVASRERQRLLAERSSAPANAPAPAPARRVGAPVSRVRPGRPVTYRH
jgi:hypothetical protein